MSKQSLAEWSAKAVRRAVCALALLSALCACNVYDPRLVPPVDHGQGEGAAHGCKTADGPCDGQDDCDAAADADGCALPNAESVCVAGQCVIASCAPGHVDCNGLASDGCEATLDSPEHCGACNVRCAMANGGGGCVEGACVLSACAGAFADCDGLASNGCERSLLSVSDCGSCGQACALPHAQMQCASGSCGFVRCQPGFGDCNHDTDQPETSDGCETDLNQASDCGDCGAQCPESTPFCSGGKCGTTGCPDGRAECVDDSEPCETSLRSVDNCGACGARCEAPPDVAVTCTSDGECALQCGAGLGDCDHAASNGCETDLHTTDNCGACGAQCSFPNAAASCGDGTCKRGACSPGYDDCNQRPDDGCEQALNTSEHCGSCNGSCAPLANAVTSCTSGSCQLASCQSGFGNCDGNAANGCETELLGDDRNCGSCGHVCSGTSTCAHGVCGCSSDSDCASGQSCCDRECVDTRGDDILNCGGCGKLCIPFAQLCCSGSCSWLWQSCR